MSLLLTVHVTEIEWKFFIWLQATQKKCNELQWKIFSCWKNFLTCSHSVHKLSSLLLFFHVPFCSEHKLNLVHHVNSSWSNFFLCCRSRKTFVVYNICVSVKQSQIILLSCIFWVFLFFNFIFCWWQLKMSLICWSWRRAFFTYFVSLFIHHIALHWYIRNSWREMNWNFKFLAMQGEIF